MKLYCHPLVRYWEEQLMNRLINIGLILLFVVFFIIRNWNASQHSIFYILLVLAFGLFYKHKTQKDNLGPWYINKLYFGFFLFIFIIPAGGYTLFATGNFMSVSIIVLIAIVIALLLSLEKEKEGEFKGEYDHDKVHPRR